MSASYDNGWSSKCNTHAMIRVLSSATSGLKVVHINAQSLNKKIDEFRYIFQNSCVDIICVSETWFRNDILSQAFNIPGYRLYRADREGHAGGVAIYVINHMKSRVIDKSTQGNSIEYMFLELESGSEKMLIGNVYRPHRNVDIMPLISILSTITLEYENIAITGDFNSNILHEQFLVDEMQSIGLTLVNSTTPTHFTASSNTLLDLIFRNRQLEYLLYEQLSAPVFSKHDLVFCSLDVFNHSNPSDETYTYRDFKRIDIDLMEYRLSTIDWDRMYSFQTVDDRLSFLQDRILDLYNELVPLRTRRKTTREKPWFTNDIKRSMEERDIAYSRWKRFRLPILHMQYRQLRNGVTEKIRQAKYRYFGRRFSESIDSGTGGLELLQRDYWADR
ncbi:uncharacterized protein LOC131994805 [Stomoxys calcitrans]|uniref:uncharacterized protein LOC131994805 n=1 Tax=Stomoxys calcitrans TaxID=35570 RepID=UPI0027E31B43|nr:uncharacterized protein LOC131994805 [Stomoxys calcitrans]